MKCRSFTAIVLAVAMLVSFGLCNLSVAADSGMVSPYFAASGEIYNDSIGVRPCLGSYDNALEATTTPFTIHYYCNTFPYSYEPALYSSLLKATSTYQTYYLMQSPDGNMFEVPITTDSDVGSDRAIDATVTGHDFHEQYRVLTENLTLYFYVRFSNIVQSYATTEYYGNYIGNSGF